MKEEDIYVHLKNKVANIKTTEWGYDFDVDNILKIDPFNIFGEIITVSVFVNRMGLLVSEMKEYVKKEKLKLSKKEAKQRQLFRARFDKKPSLQEQEDNLTMDPLIYNMRLAVLRLERELSDLESIYDSAKDKSFKLNNLSKNLTPEDFEKELIEGKINGVLVTLKNKRYKEQ